MLDRMRLVRWTETDDGRIQPRQVEGRRNGEGSSIDDGEKWATVSIY
jgi:hypothetical protein